MAALWIAGAGVLGLLLGSFANVLVYRIPRGDSIVSPPSSCPGCASRIRARHNVPVLGWLWLRGRCADCSAPISPRYPLVELWMGLSFAGVTAASGATVVTPLLLALVFFGTVLSLIDLDVRRLPNPLTAAFAITVAVGVLSAAALTGDWNAALRALWGALILGALYLAAFVVFPKGMGFGDVKLAPTLGALLGFLGWAQLAVGGFAAFLWGGLFGLAAMAQARRGKGVAIPFGPWMFVGAATGVLVGVPVADWYLGFVGL